MYPFFNQVILATVGILIFLTLFLLFRNRKRVLQFLKSNISYLIIITLAYIMICLTFTPNYYTFLDEPAMVYNAYQILKNKEILYHYHGFGWSGLISITFLLFSPSSHIAHYLILVLGYILILFMHLP